MADRIMVVAEQREGKLNRVSLETLAAAQAIAKETGWTVAVVMPGHQASALAQELAGYQVEKVYNLEGASLETYTSDAYVHALKEFIAAQQHWNSSGDKQSQDERLDEPVPHCLNDRIIAGAFHPAIVAVIGIASITVILTILVIMFPIEADQIVKGESIMRS